MSQTSKSISLSLESAPKAQSGQRLLLAVMLLSVFMAVANIFIVNVATPSIQLGLHASFSDVQFVITGYTLAYAVTLIIGGRLGDRFGRKKMLQIGVAGFTLASLLCGLSTSVEMLTIARILQGLGAALFSPQVLSLIQATYPPEKRGMIFGLYGASQGLAASTGQIIGGWLLQINLWGLDWKWVFFFCVPIGILILLMTPFIPESKSPGSISLDWLGAVLITAGLLMLVYPLVQGQKEGWPLMLTICLLLSFPVLALFIWLEKRVSLRQRVPLMNVALFGQPVFSLGMLVVFLLMSSQAAFFLVAAYLLQIGLGFSALQAGLVILPMGVGYFLASLFSARVAGKWGTHVLTIGSVLTTGGYLLLAFSVQGTGASPDILIWLPALAVLGTGQGFLAAPLTNIILSKIPSSDIGSASGILTTGMQVSFAIGISIIGMVWLGSLGHYAEKSSLAAVQQLGENPAAYQLSEEQKQRVLQTLQGCYPIMARSGNLATVPSECRFDAVSVEAKRLFDDGIHQANARNYTHSFVFVLFVLAAYTALLLLPVLVLAKKTKRT
ncbi:MFS transporter [Brevibacillus migulae]|uniref:MFS transporter n=1 Tax=Brevibacillus migulae TaxID=1644114 RepID=UPI0014320E31|nr:MFS transporter [Brevibacillus migulae]